MPNTCGLIASTRSNQIYYARAGKSEIVRKLNVPGQVVTSSTGLNAHDIRGHTIFSWAGLGLGTDSIEEIKKSAAFLNARSRWKAAKCLTIDEISMLSAETLDKLNELGQWARNNNQPFGGLQVVLQGDFLQLPPVPTSKDGQVGKVEFAFKAKVWPQLVGDREFCLKEVFRQTDTHFAEVLERVRKSVATQADVEYLNTRKDIVPPNNIECTSLFPTNDEADRVNLQKLTQLQKQFPLRVNHTYSAENVGNIADLRQRRIPAKLTLLEGVQVIIIANVSVSEGVVNGARGIVCGFTHDRYPRILLNTGKEHTLVPFTFQGSEGTITQLPLRLGYSSSIHKSQGQTLDRVRSKFDRCFLPGHTYTALSRVTKLISLHISGGVSLEILNANPDTQVLKYYERLEKRLDGSPCDSKVAHITSRLPALGTYPATVATGASSSSIGLPKVQEQVVLTSPFTYHNLEQQWNTANNPPAQGLSYFQPNPVLTVPPCTGPPVPVPPSSWHAPLTSPNTVFSTFSMPQHIPTWNTYSNAQELPPPITHNYPEEQLCASNLGYSLCPSHCLYPHSSPAPTIPTCDGHSSHTYYSDDTRSVLLRESARREALYQEACAEYNSARVLDETAFQTRLQNATNAKNVKNKGKASRKTKAGQDRKPRKVSVPNAWAFGKCVKSVSELQEHLAQENCGMTGAFNPLANNTKRSGGYLTYACKDKQCRFTCRVRQAHLRDESLLRQEASVEHNGVHTGTCRVHDPARPYTLDSEKLKTYAQYKVVISMLTALKEGRMDQYSDDTFLAELRAELKYSRFVQSHGKFVEDVKAATKSKIATFKLHHLVETTGFAGKSEEDLRRWVQNNQFDPAIHATDRKQPFCLPTSYVKSDKDFEIYVSTYDYLASMANQGDGDTNCSADDTHKLSTETVNLIVLGSLDRCGSFSPALLAFTSSIDQPAYENCIRALRDVIHETFDSTWTVHVCVTDRAGAILNSFLAVFPAVARVVCYFHLKKAIKQNKHKFADPNKYSEFCKDVHVLHTTRTKNQLTAELKAFRDKWKGESKIMMWFERNWLSGAFAGWQIALYPLPIKRTNNSIERFNGVFKQQVTKHRRFCLVDLIIKTVKWLKDENNSYTVNAAEKTPPTSALDSRNAKNKYQKDQIAKLWDRVAYWNLIEKNEKKKWRVEPIVEDGKKFQLYHARGSTPTNESGDLSEDSDVEYTKELKRASMSGDEGVDDVSDDEEDHADEEHEPSSNQGGLLASVCTKTNAEVKTVITTSVSLLTRIRCKVCIPTATGSCREFSQKGTCSHVLHATKKTKPAKIFQNPRAAGKRGRNGKVGTALTMDVECDCCQETMRFDQYKKHVSKRVKMDNSSATSMHGSVSLTTTEALARAASELMR